MRSPRIVWAAQRPFVIRALRGIIPINILYARGKVGQRNVIERALHSVTYIQLPWAEEGVSFDEQKSRYFVNVTNIERVYFISAI